MNLSLDMWQVRLRVSIDATDVAVARSILDHCLKKNVGEDDEQEEEEEEQEEEQVIDGSNCGC